MSPRALPVVRRVDVVVAGGSVAAVAAAVAAARGGSRVFLAAPRLFTGEDRVETLDLRRRPCDDPALPLTAALFDEAGWTTPLRVKRVLEDALLRAGVDVVLGALPVGVLEAGDGSLSGVVLATRSGRQAVAARALIDATAHGLLAACAGPLDAASPPTRLTATRVVLGGAESRDKPFATRTCEAGEPGAPLVYHVYKLDFDCGNSTPAGFAEFEQQARDATYRPGQLRAAGSLDFQLKRNRPPVDGLFVLDRECGEAEGEAAGAAAARRAAGRPDPEGLRVRVRTPLPGAASGDLAESLLGFRPTDVPADTAPAGADALPVLAQVGVVVAGGGTAGAAAAIAAGREGAAVLVVEFQDALGGVGTVGLIGKAYHGLDIGFAATVPFPDASRNLEHKMEWLRSEVRKAGGAVWLNALVFGAYRREGRILGVAVATPYGHGVVLADLVIDATGNADVAAAAGAETRFGADPDDIALQGTGLSARPPGRDLVNSDYLLVDESDARDVTAALLGSRQAVDPAAVYDTLPFIQTRERRRVVGEHTLRYLDQLLGRTYFDTVVMSGSDYDAHGYPSLPYFALLPHDDQTRRKNHPAPGGRCFTPYRCLLPAGLDHLLVAGLGLGMERDAAALVRMQRDLLNQGYAAGLAAAMAAADGISPRAIDIRALQRRLVALGALPESVLTDVDSPPLSTGEIEQAVAGFGDSRLGFAERSRALAAVLVQPAERARPFVRSAFRAAAEPSLKLRLAALLGFLGDDEGAALLVDALGRADWDAKILQGSMAEYAHLPTPVDALVLALGYGGSPLALAPILDKLALLDAQATLSHHRAVALALERLGDARAAAPLAGLLGKPGMGGHAMTALEPLYDKPVVKRRREGPLREIVLARALLRCGDWQGLGRRILDAYRGDVRGLFARHAGAVLAGMHTPGEAL